MESFLMINKLSISVDIVNNDNFTLWEHNIKKNGQIIGSIICECMNGKKIIPYVTKQLSIIRNDKINDILE